MRVFSMVVTAAVAMLIFTSDVFADRQSRRERREAMKACSQGQCSQVQSCEVGRLQRVEPLERADSIIAPSNTSTSAAHSGSTDALHEVNAERAKRGLKPFVNDPLLNQAANTCAKIRASRQIHGHLSSDFDHLPTGGVATAAGCGALEPSWGWGSCCTYDNYTHAGAAWVMGSDGRRYMHLFVR